MFKHPIDGDSCIFISGVEKKERRCVDAAEKSEQTT